MKIFLFIFLGLMILPESIVQIPIPMADAHPIPMADAHPIPVSRNIVGMTQQHINHDGGIECDACMFLSNKINQTIIHNPKVLVLVSNDLDKICTVLPESVQALCQNAVEQTTPVLLNHLGNFIATEGCSDLGICK
jgi:hypothetical protein